MYRLGMVETHFSRAMLEPSEEASDWRESQGDVEGEYDMVGPCGGRRSSRRILIGDLLPR